MCFSYIRDADVSRLAQCWVRNTEWWTLKCLVRCIFLKSKILIFKNLKSIIMLYLTRSTALNLTTYLTHFSPTYVFCRHDLILERQVRHKLSPFLFQRWGNCDLPQSLILSLEVREGFVDLGHCLSCESTLNLQVFDTF